MINPQKPLGSKLIYERFLPSGELYDPKNDTKNAQKVTPDENTDENTDVTDSKKIVPEKLQERLRLKNALVGFQAKHNFSVSDEKYSLVDITIQDCASTVIEHSSTCLDVTIEGKPINATEVQTGRQVELNNIFPSKISIRLKLGDL